MDQDYGHNINNADFNRRLEEFNNVLMQHVRMEETQLLPHLEKGLRKEDIDSLNTWFENTKVVAPTRPHPESPTGPAGNLATGA
jgi:hemerythrin-like domain-containing protein